MYTQINEAPVNANSNTKLPDPSALAASAFGPLNPFGLAALYSNLPGFNLPGGFPFGAFNPGESLIPVPILPQTKPVIVDGFYVFQEGVQCTDGLCVYFLKLHYHCSQPRCYFVADQKEHLLLHSKDFHDKIEILENFVFFDKTVDCRMQGCVSNRVSRHYHCTQCNFSFVQYSVMSIHNDSHTQNQSDKSTGLFDFSINSHNKHASATNGHSSMSGYMSTTPSGHSSADSDDDQGPSSPSSYEDHRKPRVKSKGTYYPLSSLPKSSTVSFSRAQLHPSRFVSLFLSLCSFSL